MKHLSTATMPRRFSRSILSLLAAPFLLGGCATIADAPLQQMLEVHAVLDYQEVAGVGCVLTNDMGRWFVVAPGRVTITRSAAPLVVDCKKAGAASGQEIFGSRPDAMSLIGNAVISAGMGIALDRWAGASWAYPVNLTVLMAPAKVAAEVNALQRVETRVF
ncbi:hypothetical protein LE190_18405 [Massilia oculi]|uniref:Lipoprotein n=1 Tax=Massilia hydrophila TaxID=3044279 RepID=A0ABS7YDT6_9BURK|nr:hypothetical protein [Massilia oculi]MCA1857880.1 hypothetical protein [Massilia oculi]